LLTQRGAAHDAIVDEDAPMTPDHDRYHPDRLLHLASGCGAHADVAEN
jgi:hypothetical protein